MSFPEEKLWDEINDGWSRMSFKQRKLWEAIKRTPDEWTLKGYGPCWVVALIGETVIYYNHFEHGFNRSPWSQFGVIDVYQSLQSGLDEAVQMQLDIVGDLGLAVNFLRCRGSPGSKRVAAARSETGK